MKFPRLSPALSQIPTSGGTHAAGSLASLNPTCVNVIGQTRALPVNQILEILHRYNLGDAGSCATRVTRLVELYHLPTMFSDTSIPSLLPDRWTHYVRNIVGNGSTRRNNEDMPKEPSAISESTKNCIPTEQTPVGILGAGNQHRIYLSHFAVPLKFTGRRQRTIYRPNP